MADAVTRVKHTLMRLLFWTVPYGIFLHGRHYLKTYQARKIEEQKFRSLEERNCIFHNCHQGDRCFILACGPSIKHQNIRLLKHETCIAVNNFFVHNDYAYIQPAYHCLADVTNWHTRTVDEQSALKWFRVLGDHLKQTALFASIGDRMFLERYDLLRHKTLYYLHLGGNWNNFIDTGIDLTRVLPGVRSVSVLALELAIYMGFQQIYLLGCDHDWIEHHATRQHFYAQNEDVKDEYSRTTSEFQSLEELFQYYVHLWHEYQCLREYAEKRNVQIYNATAGGILDVFPRVAYESLFEDHQRSRA